MKTKIIEAGQSKHGGNWGKFLIGQFDVEWNHRSAVDPGRLLLPAIGTNPACVWVLDLQTHEGASFRPGGHAGADLQKHRIWVCPMYQPMLEWLYKQPCMLLEIPDIEQLPAFVELADAPFEMSGYRRSGEE